MRVSADAGRLGPDRGASAATAAPSSRLAVPRGTALLLWAAVIPLVLFLVVPLLVLLGAPRGRAAC